MDRDNKIISFSNLYKGLRRAVRGVDWKDGIAAYAMNGLKNTYKLRQDHINGTYGLRPYNFFKVTDPKERDVMATNIRDRQFQDSLCNNYFYDVATRSLIRDNFACQKGSGVDDALDRLEVHLRRYYHENGADGYVLKCDIHHYFAETTHEIAKSVVHEASYDDDATAEIDRIIDSFPGDKGIGLGSPVSQLVQLLVLNKMDHFVKERLRIKHYVRYMDDFILIHKSKEYLQYCLYEIRKFLKKLGLALNAKTALYPLSQGIVFLKWRFKLTDAGKVIRLVGPERISHERRRLRKMKPKVDSGEISIQKPAESFMSWAAGVERELTSKNRPRRLQGKRAWEGYNAKYVEKMRDFFAELYGVDPYTVHAR